MGRHKVLNTPAIRRMPTYLHKLMEMRAAGEEYASTSKLAEYVRLEPIVVRKDFELTGIKGFPGVGYKTCELIDAIRRYLGWDNLQRACLVGAGSLGSALLGFQDFAEYNLQITDVFDADPAKIGTTLHGYIVRSTDEMEERVKLDMPELAIICVSSANAQKVVDRLVECGIRVFWSFANICLQVPPHVIVQREVVAGGYALLSMKRKQHVTG